MKIVIAPDSFKGSMSSAHVIEIVKKAAQEHFPDAEIVGIPVADGGEGTAEALKDAVGGTWMEADVHGPNMSEMKAKYLLTSDHIAFIELAAASGLPLLHETERNPLKTTTLGTGELMEDALNHGAEKLVLTIGGSATNDGGMGALFAAGMRFLDAKGNSLEPKGRNLELTESIDSSHLDPRLKQVPIEILCDVDNPLLGMHGTAYTYAKQKGANQEVQARLELGMGHYCSVIENDIHRSLRDIPGTGAAGGFSLPLLAYCNAELSHGIDSVLDIVGFYEAIKTADLVITGEGRTDEQSIHGKVISGVGQACMERNIPCIDITGGMGDGAEEVLKVGITSIVTTVNGIMSIKEAVKNCDELLYGAADRMFRLIKIGKAI